MLESPYGAAIRRAAEDRSAILAIVGTLSKADRAMVPDVVPTVNGSWSASPTWRGGSTSSTRARPDVDRRARRAHRQRAEREPSTDDALRQLALLRRQRVTLEHVARQRETLARQLESAGLALGNLRLDLVKLRASGLDAALGDVTSATQEARVLAREIGVALEAVAEVKQICGDARCGDANGSGSFCLPRPCCHPERSRGICTRCHPERVEGSALAALARDDGRRPHSLIPITSSPHR